MPAKDLTGMTFGYWTVIENSGEKTKDRNIIWTCKCQCGTIRGVNGSSLTRGLSNSCGCLKRKNVAKAAAKDISNQRFGMVVALEPTDQRTNDGSIIWKCVCDCGNICYKSLASLTRKDTINKSCGCYQHEQISKLNYKNLLNKRFGKLTVIEELAERSPRGNIVWKCECDCGKITYVETNSLTTGNTSSCGCINNSIGEKNIENLLKKNNISYIKEWSSKELNLKRFDFAIFDNNNIIRLIEFDGKQHYTDISGIWNSKETLKDIQQRDKLKNEYALSHNIPLVRIPYWERDNITLEMIMGDQYLIG